MRLRALFSDIAIGTSICCIGDVVAQKYAAHEKRHESERCKDLDAFDAKRCGAMSSYGFAAAIPYHFYYEWLAKNVRGLWAKTAIETLLVVPLFEVPAVSLWTAAFGLDLGPQAAIAHLRTNYVEAVVTGMIVWAPSSVLVFRFVQPRWHLTTFYAVGACWDAAMSRLSFGDGRQT